MTGGQLATREWQAVSLVNFINDTSKLVARLRVLDLAMAEMTERLSDPSVQSLAWFVAEIREDAEAIHMAMKKVDEHRPRPRSGAA